MSLLEKLKKPLDSKTEPESVESFNLILEQLKEKIRKGHEEQDEVMTSVNNIKKEAEALVEKVGEAQELLTITEKQNIVLQEETMENQNKLNGVKRSLLDETRACNVVVNKKNEAVKKIAEVEKEIEDKKNTSKKEIKDLDISVETKRRASKIIADGLQKEFLKSKEAYVEITDNLVVMSNSLVKKEDDFNILLAQEKVLLEDIERHETDLTVAKDAVVAQDSILEAQKGEVTAVYADLEGRNSEVVQINGLIDTAKADLKKIKDELETKTKEKMILAQKKIDLDTREEYIKERYNEAGIPW